MRRSPIPAGSASSVFVLPDACRWHRLISHTRWFDLWFRSGQEEGQPAVRFPTEARVWVVAAG